MFKNDGNHQTGEENLFTRSVSILPEFNLNSQSKIFYTEIFMKTTD